MTIGPVRVLTRAGSRYGHRTRPGRQRFPAFRQFAAVERQPATAMRQMLLVEAMTSALLSRKRLAMIRVSTGVRAAGQRNVRLARGTGACVGPIAAPSGKRGSILQSDRSVIFTMDTR